MVYVPKPSYKPNNIGIGYKPDYNDNYDPNYNITEPIISTPAYDEFGMLKVTPEYYAKLRRDAEYTTNIGTIKSWFEVIGAFIFIGVMGAVFYGHPMHEYKDKGQVVYYNPKETYQEPVTPAITFGEDDVSIAAHTYKPLVIVEHLSYVEMKY